MHLHWLGSKSINHCEGWFFWVRASESMNPALSGEEDFKQAAKSFSCRRGQRLSSCAVVSIPRWRLLKDVALVLCISPLCFTSWNTGSVWPDKNISSFGAGSRGRAVLWTPWIFYHVQNCKSCFASICLSIWWIMSLICLWHWCCLKNKQTNKKYISVMFFSMGFYPGKFDWLCWYTRVI